MNLGIHYLWRKYTDVIWPKVIDLCQCFVKSWVYYRI